MCRFNMCESRKYGGGGGGGEGRGERGKGGSEGERKKRPCLQQRNLPEKSYLCFSLNFSSSLLF